MDRFDGLRIVCIVLTVIGWIAVLGGLLMVIAYLPPATLRLALLGAAVMGSGTWMVLIAGAIQVLIGIYKNTYREE